MFSARCSAAGAAAAAAFSSSIFGEAFGQDGGERGGRGRGSDLRYDMRITFQEAARGVEKEIEISKLQACDTCHGSGAEPGSKVTTCPTCGGHGQVAVTRGFFNIAQTCPRCRGAGQTIEKPCHTCRGEGRVEKTSKIKIKIPAGVEDGTRLRSSGQGEGGARGGPAGDLYVVLHVEPHEIFQREGTRSFLQRADQLCQGGAGRRSQGADAGGQRGAEGSGRHAVRARSFACAARACPKCTAAASGDLHVKLYVEVPTQAELGPDRHKLQAFADSCDEHTHPGGNLVLQEGEGFFQMKRYYAPSLDRGLLDAEQSHHCAQVMRQDVGDLFAVFDGHGIGSQGAHHRDRAATR